MASNENTGFRPSLTLLDGTMLVAGSMIGSGIFIVSAEIARSVGGAGWQIMMWLLAGIVTLIAALSYGELSGMYPKAGGQYVYLREAYNPLVGFLYGWALFTVIQTGTIAAVAVAFAKFAAFLVPAIGEDHILFDFGWMHVSAAQLVAIAIIVLLTYINTRGVKNGKWLQTTFTLAKILSLAALIVFGFLWGAKSGIWNANWQNAWQPLALSRDGGQGTIATALSGLSLLGAVAVAMKGTLFSSDAWNNVTFIAGEIRNPKRNVGLSLFFGVLIVTVIYILANLMYLAVLPLQDIAFAPNERVAAAAATHIFGPGGIVIIVLMIMVSTFGCDNGLILSGARVYYTMALDGLFFRRTGVLNRFKVPANALWIQCLWASLLCLTGKYNDLLALVIFGVLVFYILTIAGIYILRKRYPEAERPYKAFGYPVLPAFYILVALALAVLLLIFETDYTLPGLAIILIGIPVYYLTVRKSGKRLS